MSFTYLLLPGRHQAVTKYQIEYLKQVLGREEVAANAEIIWAITSANHGGTRRNPLTGSRRLGLIEAVTQEEHLTSQVYRLANKTQKNHFAHYVVESIRLDSHGRVAMTPDNTLVLCSTEVLSREFEALGFTVDTAEYDYTYTNLRGPLPWDVIEEIIRSGAQWRASAIVQDQLHPVCFEYFQRYGLGDDIVEVFQDPLMDSDDGDITTTRDYSVYRQAFEDGAARKVADFEHYVQPGRILDVGCATGETLNLLSKNPALFESDFYGVEAARPLYQICQQRKDGGEFGDANMFFYQRNIMRSSLFPHDSLDTIITMALTHEIESYLGHDELRAFLKRMYAITAPGGVYINYDVVAPHQKNRIVYATFTDTDGENPEEVFPDITDEAVPGFIRSLSTKARFKRFVEDFRRIEGDRIKVRYETIDGEEYAVLRHADLCDFLAKKDYTNSWLSEMHERFCFWEYSDWVEALQAAGFEIAEGSEAKQNPWLIENRFVPAAKVYEKTSDDQLVALEQPVTNVLLIAKKPA